METFEAGGLTRRVARARELVLFEGFCLDLDSGQVVPEGQGEELRFQVAGPGGPRLEAVGTMKFLTFEGPVLPVTEDATRPSAGRVVRATDHADRYRIFANGGLSGVLEIKVDETILSGRLASDQTGGSYPVSGRVVEGATNRIQFVAEMPRTRLSFDGYLFSDGKGAIAGSYAMLDRTYGFFAIREGASLGLDGDDVPLATSNHASSGTILVEVRKDSMVVAAKVVDDETLKAMLLAAVSKNPDVEVAVHIQDNVEWGRVRRSIELFQSTNPKSFHLISRPD